MMTEWSKRIPRLPVSARTAENRVPGCVSPVWVATERLPQGHFRVQADAESSVVRALACAVAAIYDGAEGAEIIATEPALLDLLGINASLSYTRRHGLIAVRHRIRESVRAASTATAAQSAPRSSAS